MTVEVVVPWRGGCVHRTRALRWVLEQYRNHRLPVTVAELADGPWCKGLAANPVVLKSNADVVVVADADVWSDGIHDAIRLVERGAAWAMPHQQVLRLSETATDALLADSLAGPPNLDEDPYRGVWGGGIVVAPKATLVDVPLDVRFQGWGQEDAALGIALWFLAGPGERTAHSLTHLWHPHPQRLTRVRGNTDGWALFKRYKQARRHVDDMRALVEEGKSAHTATFDSVPDRVAVR